MKVLLVLLLLVFHGSEPINLTITTHYGETSSEHNIWATNLPYITVNIVSDDFTTTGSGFFSLMYRFANGSVIQECDLEVSNKNCEPKSCIGVTCMKDANMVLTYTINDINDSKNESTITLPQNGFAPVTDPSDWQYEKSTVIVKDCTYTSPGLDGVSLLNENVSCDFNCSDAVSCEPSYVTSTKAVCAANASWTWDGVCSKFECDWSGEPIPSILLRAVGAPAEFNVVNNNPLFNGTLFTWKLHTSVVTTIAKLVYISESSSFVLAVTQFGADARSIATDTTSNHTLIFTPTNLIHNEGLITLERDGCSSESMISNSTKLDLTYGNTTHFGSEFVPNNTKVEYKDIVMFDCNETHYEPQNFTAVLLEDATWEPSTPPITCVSKTTTTTVTTTILSTEITTTNSASVVVSTKATDAESTNTNTVRESTGIPITQTSTHASNTNSSENTSISPDTSTVSESSNNQSVVLTTTDSTNGGNSSNQACDIDYFRNAAPVNFNGICTEGCSVYFHCNDVIVEISNFTRSCERNGEWNDTSSPCSVCQEGLKDGQIAGISFIIIYVIASGVWIYFLIGRKKDKEISMTKVFILGGCKFICWIIGIALLFGTTDDTCNLTGGNIAGIVLDVLAVSMAVIFCFLVRKQFFDVRPPTAQSRVSPASVPQNGEDSPEHMEMKQDQNEDL